MQLDCKRKNGDLACRSRPQKLEAPRTLTAAPASHPQKSPQVSLVPLDRSDIVKIFHRRRAPQVALGPEIKRLRDREELLTEAARGFLACIKALALDVDEIGSETLKRNLDVVGEALQAEPTPAEIKDQLAENRDEVFDFAARIKSNLGEREAEFRQIISLLTDGLYTLGKENASFHQRLQQRSVSLEKLSQLDDLRRVRQELHSEVGQLRQTVREKQEQEAARMESLRSEVKVLQSDVEAAKKEALRDGLTGAANRLAFDRCLRDLTERAALGGPGFALLIADVDHFKEFNDAHGHPIGDRALIGLVQTLREMTRANDLVARYGGEEFALILPGAPIKPAVAKANNICKAQSQRLYTLESGAQVKFTVSIGVAAFRPEDTAATLLARADVALYAAKKRGRNRAVKEGR
jgi:diguanylate cyclase